MLQISSHWTTVNFKSVLYECPVLLGCRVFTPDRTYDSGFQHCEVKNIFVLLDPESNEVWKNGKFSGLSVQFSSVVQLCLTLCDTMNLSTVGLPVHHQILEPTQIHIHRVGYAFQPSHPLSSPSPPVPNPFQHQGLFQWVNSSHEVAKVLEFQLQHQSFQWTPQDWSPLGWTGCL